MNIALIGGTGFVGAALLQELLQRGHRVTALTRRPAALATHDRLSAVEADVLDAAQVARAVEGADAVASAYNPGWQHPQLYDTYLQGTRSIVEGVRRAGVRRLLVVGGAGSLHVAPGVQLVDTPEFARQVPPQVMQGARAARDALQAMDAETALEWTFVSPPALLQPGERSGRYRLGADDLPMDAGKPAAISVQDLAVAVVDELEAPAHVRRRFTVSHS